MKKIFGILFLSSLFFSGCRTMFGEMPEFNYKTVSPSDFYEDSKFIKDFSDSLALETGLKVTSLTKLSDNWSGGYLVELEKDIPSLSIDILTKKNMLYITVAGYRKFLGMPEMTKTPEAEALAKKIVEFYERRFPGSKLTPFIRYRGLLGP